MGQDAYKIINEWREVNMRDLTLESINGEIANPIDSALKRDAK